MWVDQLSVFVQNTHGRLAQLTQVLAGHNIDICTLSIADTTQYGILRMIVRETAKAEQVLKDAGFTVHTDRVLAIDVPDRPGGLAEVLLALDAQSVGIEYLYSFVRTPNQNAAILFKVDDEQQAVAVMQSQGIAFIDAEALYVRPQ